MSTKRQQSFEDFKALLARIEEGPECSDPNCPNAHRVQILTESITITNLIVASDLTPEIRAAIAGARPA